MWEKLTDCPCGSSPVVRPATPRCTPIDSCTTKERNAEILVIPLSLKKFLSSTTLFVIIYKKREEVGIIGVKDLGR
jgi:hypothetical protein